ncbi:MAG: P-type conjugative transfer protein TrbG [Sphingobium sp.]
MTRRPLRRRQAILLFAVIFPAMLGACATRGTPAPVIGLDTPPEMMTAAQREPEAAPLVETVAVPAPNPMPGQLMSLKVEKPGKRADQESADPVARIAAATSAARVEPAREGFMNAVQLWPWAQGALYQVYASPGRVTDIALQPGEALISVSAGDTTRWIIGDTTSGAGGSAQVHVLAKPTAASLKTNMLIHTDRRSYYLELLAHPTAWMASVAWRYPQDELIALRAASQQAAASRPLADGIVIDQLRFRYRIGGDKPSWRPVQAFDDGARVYIQFPAGIAQTDMPPLFVIGARGEAQIVNYRANAPYYIVDSLFGAAELRLGEHPQQVVRIERTDVRQARRGRQ